MATTLDEICGFLDEEKVPYQRTVDAIITGFSTRHYRDLSGQQGLTVVILPSDHGGYLEVFSPGVYRFGENPHKAVALQALLLVSWNTRLVQFEYDDIGDEIRAKVEFPLEDAPLTKNQLLRCVAGLITVIEQFDSVVRGALERGTIEWPPEIEGPRLVRLLMSGGKTPEGMMESLIDFLKQQEGRPSDGSGDGKGGDLGLGD